MSGMLVMNIFAFNLYNGWWGIRAGSEWRELLSAVYVSQINLLMWFHIAGQNCESQSLLNRLLALILPYNYYIQYISTLTIWWRFYLKVLYRYFNKLPIVENIFFFFLLLTFPTAKGITSHKYFVCNTVPFNATLRYLPRFGYFILRLFLRPAWVRALLTTRRTTSGWLRCVGPTPGRRPDSSRRSWPPPTAASPSRGTRSRRRRRSRLTGTEQNCQAQKRWVSCTSILFINCITWQLLLYGHR